MKVRNLALAAGVLFGGQAIAQEMSKLSVSGEGRIRMEDKKDADFIKTSQDRVNFTASRFRMNFNFKANDDWNAFFQPQFTKTWGQNENNAGASNTTSSDGTSGALNDTGLDVHQAYLDFGLFGDHRFQAGRQEFNYGDQLLFGGVGWHNVGRSFDALRAKLNFAGAGKVDLFSAKLVDTNTTSAGSEGSDVSGLYYMGSFGDFLKEVDVYAVYKVDHSQQPNETIKTYGARLKSSVNDLDYRVEYNSQSGRIVSNAKKSSQGQYDVEVGYKLPFMGTRLGVEYYSASEFYDQLYPTAHKWLGYADLISRRNVTGYVAHLSTKPMDKLTFKVDYHTFERTKTSSGAFKFNGTTSYGSVGTEKDVGSEIDVMAFYDLRENLTLSGLYGTFSPGKYLKAQNALQKDSTVYTYLELTAKF